MVRHRVAKQAAADRLGIWQIKHANTAWHSSIGDDEDDDFGIPRWDELEKIKGASHEAYLMNQRITSETFRHKFLDYNRPWLVAQLPSILTPRTLRRSRPYLVAQFTKILGSVNPDISSDTESDEDGDKFGPVTLSSSSRTLIRLWLAQARRNPVEGQLALAMISIAGGMGTAALLEIARVLVENDAAPARSTVFVLTDGEEASHQGMAAWLEAPTVPAEDIVVGLSMDPLGRPMLPDVWTTVILGTERSPELDALWRATGDVHEMELVFIHRDIIPLFSSDHDEFYESFSPERPSAWVVNPGMAWYHTVDDDAETIDYRVLRKAARYMTHMVHRLGNFEGAFTYRDAPEPGTQLGEDVVGLMDLVLSSDVLTGAERSAAITHRDTFQAIADAGTVDVLDNPDAQIFDAITFLLFDLNQAHPGPVPPPFPEE